MDFFAHGFWAGAAGMAANRKMKEPVRLRWVLLWGVFPDLFAFSPTFLLMTWLRWFGGASVPPHLFSRALRESLPAGLRPDELYRLSHSLIVFSAVFALVWVLSRRPVLAMLAWPLHVLMDIPSHRAGMYGTPFLWPISDYRFNGVSWGQRWFMILNYSLITAAYAGLLIWFVASKLRERREARQSPCSSLEHAKR